MAKVISFGDKLTKKSAQHYSRIPMLKKWNFQRAHSTCLILIEIKLCRAGLDNQKKSFFNEIIEFLSKLFSLPVVITVKKDRKTAATCFHPVGNTRDEPKKPKVYKTASQIYFKEMFYKAFHMLCNSIFSTIA